MCFSFFPLFLPSYSRTAPQHKEIFDLQRFREVHREREAETKRTGGRKEPLQIKKKKIIQVWTHRRWSHSYSIHHSLFNLQDMLNYYVSLYIFNLWSIVSRLSSIWMINYSEKDWIITEIIAMANIFLSIYSLLEFWHSPPFLTSLICLSANHLLKAM